MSWTQIYVKHPSADRNTQEHMRRIDEQINRFGSAFVSPQGSPVKKDDGTFEVRVFNSNFSNIIQKMLKELYGLEIINTVDNK